MPPGFLFLDQIYPALDMSKAGIGDTERRIGIRETHAAVVAAEIAMKERGIVVETVMIDTKAENGIEKEKEKGVVMLGVAALLVAQVAVEAVVEAARIGIQSDLLAADPTDLGVLPGVVSGTYVIRSSCYLRR